MKISRQTLREQAIEVLRERILAGDLPPGQVLREERLAAELGVSRTPLREALLELTRAGLTLKAAGRGFVVSPLDAREVRELYPLRALLESEALRQAGVPPVERQAELWTLNDRLRSEPPGAGWIHLDDRWHALLVEGCDNRHLLSFLELLRAHSRRYELAFLAEVEVPATSTDQHDQILRELERGDLDSACQTLAENMTVGVSALLERLEAAS